MPNESNNSGHSLGSSLGAGIKSIFGAGGRRYYILEHKTATAGHRAGDVRRIIVDYIEIGRDTRCQIRYGEDCPTVSRRHAAISKAEDGETWRLTPLSHTNDTLVNGKRVTAPVQLHNGDEIQLSTDGPRMGFIIPEGDKGLVRSIGLSARLGLFRRQALRPYRRAMVAIGVLVALLAAAGVYFIVRQQGLIREQQQALEQARAAYTREKAVQDSLIAALTADNAALRGTLDERMSNLDAMGQAIDGTTETPVTIVPRGGMPRVASRRYDNGALDRASAYVYYISAVAIDVTDEDGAVRRVPLDGSDSLSGWSGTGFMLRDGRFVTARHVIESWLFWNDQEGQDFTLNLLANNGGAVVAHFVATSPTGRTMRFNSTMFHTNGTHDRRMTTEDGVVVSRANTDETDYAWFNAGGAGLDFDAAASKDLGRGTRLTILGYPLGFGSAGDGAIQPLLGTATVSVPGLRDGVIYTTETSLEHGNSGGPVFYTDADGNLRVVGIVSAIAGSSLGFIVPLSAVR